MDDTSPPSWSLNFEPDPQPGDDLREVAFFVRDVLWDIHDREPTRRELREFCESQGFSWNHVVGVLRGDVIARNADVLRVATADEETDFRVSPSGIAVNAVRMIELLGDLCPLCPFTMPFADSWSFMTMNLSMKCGGWCCPDCGLDRAELLLQKVRDRIGALSKVHVAQVRWDAKLMSRIARRRSDHGINMFWYRRVDDWVFFVADKPFAGRNEPTSCRTLSPQETEARLVNEVLWVPGHRDHKFSEGWAFASDATGGDLISLSGLTEQEIAALMKRFRQKAFAQFGVRIEDGLIPREHHDASVALFKALLRDARRQ